MAEWILILTVIGFRTGVAIETITFPTRESCVAASNVWMRSGREGSEYNKSAACVQRPIPKSGDVK